MLVLPLAAALTASVVAAASASAAAPEYGRCVNVAVLGKVGAFKNSGCTVRATASEHKFEWEPGPGAKPKFSSHLKSETLATIETEKGPKFTCKQMHDAGEVTGPKTGIIQFTFEGCESSSLACTTPGQAAGVIATPVLPSRLIIIKKEATANKTKVGNDIGSVGGLFAEFECGPVNVVISGSWIWPVKTNAMFRELTYLFNESEGHQKGPEKGEGEPKDVLEASIAGGAPERVGLSFTQVQVNEQKSEVNTVV